MCYQLDYYKIYKDERKLNIGKLGKCVFVCENYMYGETESETAEEKKIENILMENEVNRSKKEKYYKKQSGKSIEIKF